MDDRPFFIVGSPRSGTTLLRFMLASLYRSRMADSGAARWGDKTPGYILRVQLVARIFPSAQFIQLIRVRDPVSSTRTGRWRSRRFVTGPHGASRGLSMPSGSLGSIVASAGDTRVRAPRSSMEMPCGFCA